MHHFRTMLVLALFCALFTGFSPALAQGDDDWPMPSITSVSVVPQTLNFTDENQSYSIDIEYEFVGGYEGLIWSAAFRADPEDHGGPSAFDERIYTSNTPIELKGTYSFEIDDISSVREGTYSLYVYIADGAYGYAEAIYPNAFSVNNLNISDPETLVIHNLEARTNVIDLSNTPPEVVFDFDVEETSGVGLGQLQLALDTFDPLFVATSPAVELHGQSRATGTIRLPVDPLTPPGEYPIVVNLTHAGPSRGLEKARGLTTPESFTFYRGGDGPWMTPPVLTTMEYFQGDLDVTDGEGFAGYDFRIESPGRNMIDEVKFEFWNPEQQLVHEYTIDYASNNYLGLLLDTINPLSFHAWHNIPLPASMPEGDYEVRVQLTDQLGNVARFDTSPPIRDRILSITNGNTSASPPELTMLALPDHELRLTPDHEFLRVEYDVRDNSPAGLGTLEVRLTNARGYELAAIADSFAGQAHGSGFLNIPLTDLPRDQMGPFQLSARLTNSLGIIGHDYSELAPASFDSILLIYPDQDFMGPFRWSGSGDTNSPYRDIFRLTGLHNGMPESIIVLDDSGTEQCDLTLLPTRYSGAEYLILTSELSQCGTLPARELAFLVTASAEDIQAGLTLRRFKVGPTGLLTDLSSDTDPAQLTLSQRQASRVTFGPFEWVEQSDQRQSVFLFEPLEAEQIIKVAVANSSEVGFTGSFNDCQLISSLEGPGPLFVSASMLLDSCGSFGRADLSFEISGFRSSIPANLSVRRLIYGANGAVADFRGDTLNGPQSPISALDERFSAAEFGPFEWTGDANAPTQSLFRLTGIEGGLPTSISVALGNAASPVFQDDFLDCELAIDETRAGDNDYLIHSSDLSACGAFGRADLRFLIVAPTNSMDADGLRLRRLAIGAHGDITDFGFDLDASAATTPTPIANGLAEIEFGPFEWTGDHTVSTQNVFRISGLSGAPESIDLALMNATQEGYQGDFTDCSLQIRPNRVGRNEFVIASNDLVDCDGFLRADIRFRIRAQADQFADEVRMRRFAVTTNGGLTDFGFDTQPRP